MLCRDDSLQLSLYWSILAKHTSQCPVDSIQEHSMSHMTELGVLSKQFSLNDLMSPIIGFASQEQGRRIKEHESFSRLAKASDFSIDVLNGGPQIVVILGLS